jgi:signal transduction histidine kinase
MWLFLVAVITMIGVGAGIFAAGLPDGTAGISTVALLVLATVLSAAALSPRIRDLRVIVPALVGVGLCGAGLDWEADGPGFMAGYVALVGLALRAPRRIAVLAGTPVMAAVTAEGAYESDNPTTASLAVLFAFGLLFTTSVFAAVSLDARRQAETLLAQVAAAAEAREEAAALAERSRLARDLHDVLAHSLATLSVLLETARMTAITAASGARLVSQITAARDLSRAGMLDARRALRALRGHGAPGPASLPELVSETATSLGIHIRFETDGIPGSLAPEARLTLYRVVQEALTNVAKHAGRGAEVSVRLIWEPDAVEASVYDSGGDGVDAGLPSGGFGLTGMAERAAANGGQLQAGRSGSGFAVRLRLPVSPPGSERPASPPGSEGPA